MWPNGGLSFYGKLPMSGTLKAKRNVPRVTPGSWELAENPSLSCEETCDWAAKPHWHSCHSNQLQSHCVCSSFVAGRICRCLILITHKTKNLGEISCSWKLLIIVLSFIELSWYITVTLHLWYPLPLPETWWLSAFWPCTSSHLCTLVCLSVHILTSES